jgi:hypothetical protein
MLPFTWNILPKNDLAIKYDNHLPNYNMTGRVREISIGFVE